MKAQTPPGGAGLQGQSGALMSTSILSDASHFVNPEYPKTVDDLRLEAVHKAKSAAVRANIARQEGNRDAFLRARRSMLRHQRILWELQHKR